jgi:hypothetical protein
MIKHWHEEHRLHLTIGHRLADSTARLIGSWPFIIWQSVRVNSILPKKIPGQPWLAEDSPRRRLNSGGRANLGNDSLKLAGSPAEISEAGHALLDKGGVIRVA